MIGSLQSGGAERVMSILANAWAERGESVTLVTFLQPDESSHYKIDDRVNLLKLGLLWSSKNFLDSIFSNIRRHRLLRSAIRAQSPDVIISFCDTTNVRTILATLGLGVPIIVSERIDPAKYSIPKAWSLLRKFTYPLADRIVVQTERIRPFFKGRALRRCIVIPNPVLVTIPEGAGIGTAPRKSNALRLLAVGRLDHQKGFDLLIEAFSRINVRFSEWELHIFGEGVERRNLEGLIASKSLQEKVFLRGITKNINAEYLTSDLFVLSSRFEGIPNALCEAMAAGMPVISFDCPTGPKEIIEHNVNGVLVPPEDPDALTAALQNLMSSPSERRRLGKAALELSSKYSLNGILKLWDSAIDDALVDRGLFKK